MRVPGPSRTTVYIAGLALSAAALLGWALAVGATPTTDRAVLAAVLAGLLVPAYLYPLQIRPGSRSTLGTAVLFAAVLLFGPALAMGVGFLGRAISVRVRREPADQAVFNVAQTALQAGTGSLLLEFADWDPDRLGFDDPARVPLVALAALGMYLVNTLSVATAIGLDRGRSPLAVWRGSVAATDAADRLPQFALGAVGALVADAYPWALPLLLLPVWATYQLGERHARLHEQARVLERRAYHDPLTGLPNRVLLLERLAGAAGAVLYVDLDTLKCVNDRYGHKAGDALLVAVAGRLRGCVRSGDTAARLGGDEFVLLLAGADEPEAVRVAERVLAAFRAPIALGAAEVMATASVGVAVTEGDASPLELLDAADRAMYRAKAAGKARYALAWA